jgi:hypothetical protein
MAALNEQYNIVHNDLHGNNIMVNETLDDVDVYIFPDGEEFAFETFGLNPVIIDFGFSFPGILSKKMLTPAAFYKYNIIAHVPNMIIDSIKLRYMLADKLPKLPNLPISKNPLCYKNSLIKRIYPNVYSVIFIQFFVLGVKPSFFSNKYAGIIFNEFFLSPKRSFPFEKFTYIFGFLS